MKIMDLIVIIGMVKIWIDQLQYFDFDTILITHHAFVGWVFFRLFIYPDWA